MTNRPVVFLSHNGSDKSAVEDIQRRLESCEPPFRCWLDKDDLRSRGTWMSQIEHILDECESAALFFGPSGRGPIHELERQKLIDRAARQSGSFWLVPVLLPGARKEDVQGFTSLFNWVDFSDGLDSAAALERLALLLRGEAPKTFPDADRITGEPYRGLLAFEAEHARFFFGRDSALAGLLAKLRAGNFVVLIGASGSGKSSLVRAKLLPAVKKSALSGGEAWETLIVRPGGRPLRALAEQLATLAPAAGRVAQSDELMTRLWNGADALGSAASALTAERPRPILLVVDQFEELFTQCPDGPQACRDQIDRFVANLANAVLMGAGRFRVLVVLRADFLERCLKFHRLQKLFENQVVLLGPLTVDERRAAIVRPAQGVGAYFEKGLVDTILRDVDADVAAEQGTLPLLQHALLELWNARRGRWLTVDAYLASGGVAGALERRAQSCYDALTGEQKVIARDILVRLSALGEGVSDTRRRVARSELCPVGVPLEEIDRVILALSDESARLIVADDQTVELAHETLIQRWRLLREWLGADDKRVRETVRMHRQLTEGANLWEESRRNRSYLYQGTRLASAQEWAKAHQSELNERENEFIRQSVALSVRKRRVLVVTTALVIVLLTVLSIVALYQRAIAVRRLADFRRLADIRLLGDLTAEAETLWPATTNRIPKMEDWLTRARIGRAASNPSP